MGVPPFSPADEHRTSTQTSFCCLTCYRISGGSRNGRTIGATLPGRGDRMLRKRSMSHLGQVPLPLSEV